MLALQFRSLFIIFIVSLSWLSLIYTSYSSKIGDMEGIFERVYALPIQAGASQIVHKIYVSVPSSLYYFYRGECHSIFNINDYGKFVTPEAVRPIAECIREIVGGDNESFVNAVLTIIQQMSYIVSDIKYPVETLVEGDGDCDVFSLLAASVMKAGDLDVVLFYYKDLNPAHMNVGVFLNYTPSHHWWKTPAFFEYQGKQYWVAECTPQKHWRVGEQPEIVANLKPIIVPLNSCEGKSPAKVSASLDKPLKASSISASILLERSSTSRNSFIIQGSILPGLAEQPVTVYTSKDEKQWRFLGEALTDTSGNYTFRLNVNLTGLNYFKTSWSGASGYAGSDSNTIVLLTGRRIKPNVPEDFDIPNDPILRAQAAMIFKIYRLLNRDAESNFFKQLVLKAPTTLSGEFAVLEKGNLNYTFGFMLSDGNVNYTVKLQAAEEEDIFQIVRQTDENETALVKVETNLRENCWYRVEVEISGDYLTAKLYENEIFLKGIGVRWQNGNATILGTFMKCYNSTLAFKNLKIGTLGEVQTPANIGASNVRPWLVYLIVLVTSATCLTVILELKRRVRFT